MSGIDGVLSVLAPLALVLALLFALRFGLAHLGDRSPLGRARRLRVVESCALSTKARLFVVEVDGRSLVVGASEAGIGLVHDLGTTLATEIESVPAEVEERDNETNPAPVNPAPAVMRALGLALALTCFAAVVPSPAVAETSGDIVLEVPEAVTSALGGDAEERGGLLEMLALLTVVAIAPSILLMATCFTRIVIVLAFVRQAIGVQHLPPNQVLVGLALFLTLFVMAPVGERIHTDAYAPYIAGELDGETAVDRALVPIREYLASHTREADLALFVEIADVPAPETSEDVPLRLMMPAFLVSELRKAFEIGFAVFLPFLIIDLVVSSMLISMGMIVLPPIVISLPFKVMLFVLVDGWNLILGSLVQGLV